MPLMFISWKKKPHTQFEGYGFFKRLFSHQRHLGNPGVTCQVVAGAVSTPHDLDPALRVRGVYRQIAEDTEEGDNRSRLLTYEVLVSASQQSQA